METQLDRIRHERIRGTTKVGEILKEIDMIWTHDEKKLGLCRREDDGNRRVREEEDRRCG